MININFQWCRLEQLNAHEVHMIIAAREAVFVVEQNCPYQEADKYDFVSWHLIARNSNEIAAYLRVVDPWHKYNEPSIGRVLTVKKYRGTGLGKKLTEEAIKRTNETFPNQKIRISAQSYLLNFYKSFGFEPVGGEYLEDNIPHTEMIRN